MPLYLDRSSLGHYLRLNIEVSLDPNVSEAML